MEVDYAPQSKDQGLLPDFGLKTSQEEQPTRAQVLEQDGSITGEECLQMN